MAAGTRESETTLQPPSRTARASNGVSRRASATPATTTPDEYTRAPPARTNDGGLIYAGHAGEVARHAGRPAAGERAAQLEVHVVGDGRRAPPARGPLRAGVAAPTTAGHDEPDAGSPRGRRGEEREERAGERRAAGAARSRVRHSSAGAGEQSGAGGARVAASSAVSDERDGVAGHRRQPASPARLALNAWMASTGVGSTP